MKNTERQSFNISTLSKAIMSSITSAAILPLGLGVSAIAAQVQADDELLLELEEIVVTARKVEENAQESPVAVSAFDAEALAHAGIDSIDQLKMISPSVYQVETFNKTSGSTVTIRGIGTYGSDPAFEGAVGIYIDGVYRSRPGMALGTMNDIAGVEVLRGPQGTLFGKNTTAGAMLLTSAEPTDEFTSGVSVKVGNYDRKEVRAHIGGFVTDDLGLRLSVLDNERDGYIENPDTDETYQYVDDKGAKLNLIYDVNEDLSIKVIADYLKSESQGNYGAVVRRNPELTDATDPLIATLLAAIPAHNGNYYNWDADKPYNILTEPGKEQSKDKGVVFDVNYDIGDMSLRSLTSYREYEHTQENADIDMGLLDLLRRDEVNEIDTFSQEFNLTGDYGDLSYVGGLYYSKETYELTREVEAGVSLQTIAALGAATATPGLPVSAIDIEQDNEVAAIFGQFDYQINDDVSAFLGLRYSREEKDFSRKNLFGSDYDAYGAYLAVNHSLFLALPGTTGPDFEDELVEEELTYAAGIQYFVNEDTQLYATFSHGHKAGGFSFGAEAGGRSWGASPKPNLNPDPSALLPGFGGLITQTFSTESSYDPEFVDSLELGLKMDYMDSRGRLNIALFHSQYDDIQLEVFNGAETQVLNSDEATVQGIELENTFLLSEGLTSVFSVTHLPTAEFGDVPEEVSHLQDRRLPAAPKWSVNFQLAYDRPLNDVIDFYSTFGVAYKDTFFGGATTNIKTHYTLYNLVLGLRDVEGSWDLSLSCQNCTDEIYSAGSFAQPFYVKELVGATEAAAAIVEFRGAPRTWTLNLGYNF